ncbi:hypothetical protein PRZ48_002054 [Zasmidium cellare]|uniref:Uncharacterized protein n=1 Tax=Zasmidium cellare TaxID=395010 RepID=A0ABR0F4P3_ZASCE|nr:hypothetical protein PRZ48_002054 [Zasmidium cellare]
MQLTAASISAILAFLYAAPIAAQEPVTTCNGSTEPDWADCDAIEVYFKNMSASEFTGKAGECFSPPTPDGKDPNSLNCFISVCFDSSTTQVEGQAIDTDYTTLREICDISAPTTSGGNITDSPFGISVAATNNPDSNPPSKRSARPSQRSHARNWPTLERRDGTCVDGTGSYELFATYSNSQRPGYMIQVTGRLSSGSTYMIQDSDAQTIGVSTSVTVEDSFFDLFDASASVSVMASDTETSTVGVNVNIDCEMRQEGIVYLVPLYTYYAGFCTSDNNTEIDVFSPIPDQNNYMVQCLGDGSS